jgi:ATP-dependent DNA ligase
MQCKAVSALPAGEKWTFEIKFDGYRCIAVKRGQEVTLFSRHEKVLNNRFPLVVEFLTNSSRLSRHCKLSNAPSRICLRKKLRGGGNR